MWGLKVCIVGDNFCNESLLVEIYAGAAFHNLRSNISILIDGVSLTGNKFNRSHPVVFYPIRCAFYIPELWFLIGPEDG